jgi:hypothetical protein
MKNLYRACRCLAIAICVPGMVLQVMAIWNHVPEVLRVLFSFDTHFVAPTAGEIIEKSLSGILQPVAFLVVPAGLWLLTDIAEALHRHDKVGGEKQG